MTWTKAVTRAARGDQAAWDELYTETRKEAYFVALKVCKSPQDAEDLVQEAYLTALEKLPQLQDPERFPSWLNMIVANKCRDYLKKKKPTLFTDLQQEDTSALDWADDREGSLPDVRLDRQETNRLVAEMIDDLPEDQKLCLLLYYRDELSVAQIAKALQVSEGTVKSRLNYGRQKVKAKVRALEKQGTKLYGLSPMVLLTLLLRQESEGLTLPTALTAGAPAAAVGSAAATTGGAVITAAAAKAAGGLATKIVAGVLAAGLVAGGAAAAKQAIDRSTSAPDMPPTQTVMTGETVDNAPEEPLEETNEPQDFKIYETPFTFHFPADWEGKVEAKVTGGSATTWESYTLYETESHAAGAGRLLTITLFLRNDTYYEDWPNYRHLGTFVDPFSGLIFQFVASHPTDVQFYPPTPERQREVADIYDSYDTILDNIEWNWLPYEE